MDDPAVETDEALVRRCQAGDFAAFEVLYARHQRPIMAYIFQITRDYDASACIAQDTFLKVFEHVASFDTSRRFTTWFYAIARNAAIDHLQRRQRRPVVAVSDLDPDEDGSIVPRSSSVSVETALARRESTVVLSKALEALPQIHREIIELVVFQGVSYEDASEILGGTSPGTLRSRMHHALRRLRVALEPLGGSDGDGLL